MRDTSAELARRLKKDLRLQESSPLVDAIVTAVIFCLEEGYLAEGYADMDLFRVKYPDLFCPWDGRLHRDVKCDHRVATLAVMKSSEALANAKKTLKMPSQ